MKAIINQFLERAWIAHFDSERRSPAFIVLKKSKGSRQLVVDYRRLNSMTEMHSCGILLINDFLQDPVQKRLFSVLDIKLGYHQMKLAEESQDCTTMSMPFGTYKWLVMPIGLKNGNAAFQLLLDVVLKDYRDFARPFMDDIIVGSGGATYEEALQNHVKHLRLVLQRLREKRLAASAEEANMFVEHVEFAGHVVGYGVKRPILCLEKWDKPRTVSELMAFLGFANYYQEFVRLYAHHAAPLYSMLQLSKPEARKGSNHLLHWTPERDTAFEDLKQEIAQASCPLLGEPPQALRHQNRRERLCHGRCSRANLQKGEPLPCGILVPRPQPLPEEVIDPQDQGGLCNCERPLQMGWPH